MAKTPPLSTTRLHIALLDGATERAWDAYVCRHPLGSVFHTIAWQRAVEQVYAHKRWYLLALRGDAVCGVMPMAEIRSVVTGHFMVSVPYATYGGVLADDDGIAHLLIRRAVQIAAQRGARSIELRSVVAAEPDQPVSRSHVQFQKALPALGRDVVPSLPRKTRAAVRRAAERYGLTTTFAQRHLPIVWELYADSMRRLGSPNHALAFFRALAGQFGDRCLVQVVWCDGRPVAGLLTLLDGDTVRPYFAGQEESVAIYGLNNYLYATSMAWAANHGFRNYDFGRTRTDNEGVRRFKASFGFEARPLNYQVLTMPGCKAPELSPSAPRWAVARRMWRHLPLQITRPIGGWLLRGIPG